MRKVTLLLAFAFAACSAPVGEEADTGTDRTPSDRRPVATGDVEAPDAPVDTGDTGEGSGDVAPDVPDVALPDTGPPDTFDRVDRECTSVEATGEPVMGPVDIVWVIDTSGSMNEEKTLVETKLNEFVTFIEDSGLDVRVVMIGADSVCVPEPLSGGGCPDTDSERYRHVRRNVGSDDSFKHIIDGYDAYADFLRPEAALHFVIVSDDESGGSRTAAWFRDELATEGVSRWVLHAIVSLVTICEPPPFPFFPPDCEGCSGPHGDAEAKGDRYIVASEISGGTANSICDPDWSGVFRAIGDNVISSAALPCAYAIPDVGAGREIVFDAVDVEINGDLIPRLDHGGECRGGAGWYYDNPETPTQILFCPSTCGEGFEGDEVDIQFGCVKA